MVKLNRVKYLLLAVSEFLPEIYLFNRKHKPLGTILFKSAVTYYIEYVYLCHNKSYATNCLFYNLKVMVTTNLFFVLRGSAIAKIVGRNAARLPNFEDRVTMWVYEEMIDGKKLTEIINETHENVKYLPGHKLPPNVVS